MSRAAVVLLATPVTTGCAKAPGADPAAAPVASPTTRADDSGLLTYRGIGVPPVDVCRLVPARRVGGLLGRPGVHARDSGEFGSGNQVGACTHTAADLTLNLAVHMADPALPAEEFVTGATEGRGRPIPGVGDAAALARHDDGSTTLVAVHGDRVLPLTGTGAPADAFTKIATEALPGLALL